MSPTYFEIPNYSPLSPPLSGMWGRGVVYTRTRKYLWQLQHQFVTLSLKVPVAVRVRWMDEQHMIW